MLHTLIITHTRTTILLSTKYRLLVWCIVSRPGFFCVCVCERFFAGLLIYLMTNTNATRARPMQMCVCVLAFVCMNAIGIYICYYAHTKQRTATARKRVHKSARVIYIFRRGHLRGHTPVPYDAHPPPSFYADRCYRDNISRRTPCPFPRPLANKHTHTHISSASRARAVASCRTNYIPEHNNKTESSSSSRAPNKTQRKAPTPSFPLRNASPAAFYYPLLQLMMCWTDGGGGWGGGVGGKGVVLWSLFYQRHQQRQHNVRPAHQRQTITLRKLNSHFHNNKHTELAHMWCGARARSVHTHTHTHTTKDPKNKRMKLISQNCRRAPRAFAVLRLCSCILWFCAMDVMAVRCCCCRCCSRDAIWKYTSSICTHTQCSTLHGPPVPLRACVLINFAVTPRLVRKRPKPPHNSRASSSPPIVRRSTTESSSSSSSPRVCTWIWFHI